MSIRAKFKVVSVTRSAGWNGIKEVHTIRLQPVTSGSTENAQFYAATPGGSIELCVVNEATGNQFEIGGDYYIDFSRAD